MMASPRTRRVLKDLRSDKDNNVSRRLHAVVL